MIKSVFVLGGGHLWGRGEGQRWAWRESVSQLGQTLSECAYHPGRGDWHNEGVPMLEGLCEGTPHHLLLWALHIRDERNDSIDDVVQAGKSVLDRFW